MDIKQEEEIKKEFQLERVVLFTDAVFAIILTIMVLEIRLPEGLRHAEDEHIREALLELITKFAAYIVSFCLVAQFWVVHLKLFRFLKDYDIKLLCLNLFFLFSVSLFPFTSSLISGNISQSSVYYTTGFSIYMIVLYSGVFAQTLMARYLIKNKATLCDNAEQLEQALRWKLQRINLFMMPILITLVIAFNIAGVNRNYIICLAIVYGITVGIFKRKYYPKNPGDESGPLIARLFRRRKLARKAKTV